MLGSGATSRNKERLRAVSTETHRSLFLGAFNWTASPFIAVQFASPFGNCANCKNSIP
jgi:hypothetical protein